MRYIGYCINSILDDFSGFNGVGFVFVLLLVAIGILHLCEKKEEVRAFTVKYPLYILLVFFCPLWWGYIYLTNDQEILYRILWAMPIGLILVYTMVKIAFTLTGNKRMLAFLASIVLIVASGRYLYSNEIFTPAENEYHVPETVVKICDEIIVPGREILCCFPDEMVTYVRQYTPYVLMPYGRGVLFDWYEFEYELRSIVNSETIDSKLLTSTLRDLNTPYLVVSEDKSYTQSLSTYGFVYVTTIDGYEIYLDNEAYLGLDFISFR